MAPNQLYRMCYALTGLTAVHAVSIYSYRLDPTLCPAYGTNQVKPPAWGTFGNSTTFATLRGFAIDGNNNLSGYNSTLAAYAQFGNVIWPDYETIFAANFQDLVSYMAANGFLMTDLWGYVPGSGPGAESWQAFTPPADNLAFAAAVMGDAWLGMDVGEQDGRYIAYSGQHAPMDASPREQLEFFDAHFTAMQRQLGNRVVSLASLTFTPYMAAAGVYTVLGAETAQALVNGQLFYAIIRGAGKTYGILYFGNVSVYSRFGYKSYTTGARPPAMAPPPPAAKPRARPGRRDAAAPPARTAAPNPFTCTNQGEGGPTCGTSLSLMARLMFAQIWYGSAYVSFENGWFASDGVTVSPIGQLQLAARQWLATNGPPGVLLATTALLLDYHAGFTAPRHLYTGDFYRVWGNLPYAVARGDYLTDAALRLFYPQYQDSSYFHDETGFSSPTPYADSLDVLLSDAPAYLLQRYDTIIMTGTPATETSWLQSKLAAYIASGGRVIAWSGALAALGGGGLASCSSVSPAAAAALNIPLCASLPPQSITIAWPGAPAVNVTEAASFTACTVTCTGPNVTPLMYLTSDNSKVLAWSVPSGINGGSLIVLASPYGAADEGVPISGTGIDQSLTSPFPLLAHVSALLDAALRARAIVSVPTGLTYAIAVNGSVSSGGGAATTYNVLVSNPSLSEQPFSISPLTGTLVSLTELPINTSSVKAEVGYLPDGYQGSDLGNSTDTTIAGVDTRIFRVVVNESAATVRPLPQAVPPSRPRFSGLHVHALRGYGVASLRSLVLAYPSVPQLFDTLVVDYSYIQARTRAEFADEASWLLQRGIHVIPDFTAGLNLFPNLRLFNNSEPEYSTSLSIITSVLASLSACYSGAATHAILSLHRTPENNMDTPTAVQLMAQTLTALAPVAAAGNTTLHLRHTMKNDMSLAGLNAWVASQGLSTSIAVAPSTAAMLINGDASSDMVASLKAWAGTSMLLVAADDSDATGTPYTESVPVTASPAATQSQIAAFLTNACATKACGLTGDVSTPALMVVVDAHVGAGLQGGQDPTNLAGGVNVYGRGVDAAYFDAAWMQTTLSV